jgi:hypothetical protein
MLSHRLKGEMESSAKTKGFHSTPSNYSSFAVTPHLSPTFGIIFTHILFTIEGESSLIRAYISLKYPFLAIHAKGGESISPKQKDRTTTKFKNLVFQFVFKEVFQNWYLILI